MENTLGKYLHEEREKRNMSLREFSELLGISHTYLKKLETGCNPSTGKPVSPTIETLNEISKALHVSLEYLLEVSGFVKGNKFDQAKYMREWQKENMKQVKASYKTEFVDEFKEACKKLGIKQSDVIRKAMQDTIEKANNI